MPELHHHSPASDRLRIVSRWVFWGFVAIAAFFLITEHRAHLYGWWPFLLLAACPLLHLFHHGGHNHDGNQPGPGESARGAPPNAGSSGHHH